MSRKEVYAEMKDMFGLVPSFFKTVPDSTLELEWSLFKRIQIEDSEIPQKYRELIGVGISAATKCRYCSLFHAEMAKLNGATDAEIEEAVHYAKASAGWSAYLNGMQADYDVFKDELSRVVKYIKAREAKKAA